MKYTDLLPSLLNWPFIIIGLVVIGNLPPFGLIAGIAVFGYELYRTRKIHRQVSDGLTPDVIREYFARDPARKYLPVKDQIHGMKNVIAEKAA